MRVFRFFVQQAAIACFAGLDQTRDFVGVVGRELSHFAGGFVGALLVIGDGIDQFFHAFGA